MQTDAMRPDILAILEDNGYRITEPRREIIHALSGRREGFAAEEIVSELPQVGRATIFRTLKLLLETGAICRLNMLDGAPRYSLARIEHHHHAVCVRCGLVSEFRAATLERMMRTIGTEVRGEIVGHRIDLYVVCPSCMEREGSLLSVEGRGQNRSHARAHAYDPVGGSSNPRWR